MTTDNNTKKYPNMKYSHIKNTFIYIKIHPYKKIPPYKKYPYAKKYLHIKKIPPYKNTPI